MSVGLIKNFYLPGEFDPKIVDRFFASYPFLPYKDKALSYEEDDTKLYVSYNTYKMESLGDMPPTRNIWCFDKRTGERLWVIEQEKGNNPRVFTGASIEDGVLRVGTTQGLDYDLDPETGKISNPVFTK